MGDCNYIRAYERDHVSAPTKLYTTMALITHIHSNEKVAYIYI